MLSLSRIFFSFIDTATTEIYTLSLHDALPISTSADSVASFRATVSGLPTIQMLSQRYSSVTSASGSSAARTRDRKSTRLNSSHTVISYAVFCLKKKKKTKQQQIQKYEQIRST